MLLRERVGGGTVTDCIGAPSAETESELGETMRALGDREEGAVAALTKELNV